MVVLAAQPMRYRGFRAGVFRGENVMRKSRAIRIEGGIAIVPLTQGYEAIIDAEDVHLVDGFCWHALPYGYSTYASRQKNIGGNRKNFHMHRVIAQTPDHLFTDHIDGDGLNNRRANLRNATCAQNNSNKKLRSDNTSGLLGVSWHKRDEKWAAQIATGGKTIHLGYFLSPREAHEAYSAAAKSLHGEFASRELKKTTGIG